MPSRATRTQEEISGAGKETLRGGIIGLGKWGLIGGGLAFVGFWLSPVYRNLTIQFKIYIQMSFMTFGGMVGADRSMRNFQSYSRLRRKLQNDEAAWAQWETMLKEEERLENNRTTNQKDGG